MSGIHLYGNVHVENLHECHLVFSNSEKCEVLQYGAREAQDSEKVRKWLKNL